VSATARFGSLYAKEKNACVYELSCARAAVLQQHAHACLRQGKATLTCFLAPRLNNWKKNHAWWIQYHIHTQPEKLAESMLKWGSNIYHASYAAER
jgi:hypothetical protein